MRFATSLFSSVVFLFSILYLTSVSYPVIAGEQKVNIESYDWNGAIPETKVVIVKNAYGSIRSRSNSEPKIFLHASYQEIGESPLTPKFTTDIVNGNLVIEVIYSAEIIDNNGHLRGRTDISILFPPQVKIIAETTHGMIKIDKSESEVEAITTSGDIKLTTSGLFKTKTISGKTTLRLRGMHTHGVSESVSETGPIKADIFEDMDIKFKAETSGEIVFNGNPLKQKELFRQQGDATSIVNFRATNGAISVNIISPPALVKSVKPTKTKVDLRTLPKSKNWKPGDEVKEVNPKRTGKDKKDDEPKN